MRAQCTITLQIMKMFDIKMKHLFQLAEVAGATNSEKNTLCRIILLCFLFFHSGMIAVYVYIILRFDQVF